ncbi:VOC family protein [Gordonia sp. TBRC 11910]|uniref:VOC family protein n=1 Tax=Gordonia asplenii TaxID=2725283 RepID=A0A848L9X4_9ACTN|nr:VOC family protein [Gordonia asplenii]NMO04378.1 VOC family protein [Gordonia asplenii]
MHIRWLTAFFDFPAPQFGDEVTFWRAIAGSTVSPPRGSNKEFASLEPFNGDPHLRVQRVNDGPGGLHLDLHVSDHRAGADECVRAGAVLTDASDPMFAALRTPAGLPFCVNEWKGEAVRSRPIRWPGASISIIDEVLITVPHKAFDAEVAFFSTVTGWTIDAAPPQSDAPASTRFLRDDPLPLSVVLTPVDDEHTAAQVSLAATSVADEVARHEDWGATVIADATTSVVMADPVGRRYRITNRNPRSGR